MKKTLLLVAVLLLLAASAAGVYVLNDPAGFTQFIGGGSKAQPRARASVVTAAAKTSKPGATQDVSTAAEPDAGAKAAPADEFDRKAASSPEVRRPPKRAEGKSSSLETTGITVARKGSYTGVINTAASEEPPTPDQYPFAVIKRTYPDARSITVEFAIRNSSGTQWKTAYVALRSSRHPETVQFQIPDWQIDEIVGFDYTFPRDEVQDRMFELRVVGVSGDKRQSALAERLKQSRRKYVEVPGAKKARNPGETLTAIGMLGVIGRIQAPVTGIQIKTAEYRSPDARPLTATISDDLKFPADLSMSLRETSDERKAVVELAQEFHKAALDAQGGLVSFAEELHKEPYEKAIRGAAATSLANVRSKLNEFNTKGVELATKIQLSSDSDVRKLSSLVPDYSRKMLAQVSSLESQVQSVDEGFKIQQNQ